MAQLMPLPLTVSCSSKIQTGFTFLAPAHPGSPGQRAIKRVCVCVYTGQPALELEDFVGAKFKRLHALADGNQYIRIREKMLEFSSTLLSALSPYLEYKVHNGLLKY